MGRVIRASFAIALFIAVIAPGSAQAVGRCGDHPWCDTALSPGKRAALLVRALTLEERLSLMAGDDPVGVFTGEPATGTSEGIPRLDVPTVYYSDGPVGPREGEATAMPAPLALAATFDPLLARLTGSTVANEVKNKGNDVVHAPAVDIMRTPLAGRTFEGYGEDPFLSSRLAVPWIRGSQSEGLIGNVKHFALNSQEGQIGLPPLAAVDGGRAVVDAVADERTLREIYLPPFEAAVKKGRVGTVMCAYNRVNGSPACQSGDLLERILRRDWGFRGFVVTDYGFAQKSTAESANNGLELEMPLGSWYSQPALGASVATGRISEETVDERVGNILRTMFRFGVFDRPAYPSDDSRIDVKAHARVARRVEERAITLLKNRRVLPLDSGELESIAIIGSDADGFKGGGGSSAVEPFHFTSPREAITRRAGRRIDVRYDPGEDTEAAAETAKGADVALVFASDAATEGVDKPCLALRCTTPDPVSGEPLGELGRGDPDELIEAVAAANPRTIVVLETAGPVLTPWTREVEAVVEAWYPGQGAGAALARVLFGDVDPGGRLPVTFPRRPGDIPTAGDREQYPGVAETARYKEGVLVGYRHYDEHRIAPRWEFGFGLSYAHFRYSDLRVGRRAVSAVVRNVSGRPGADVAQLYIGMPEPRPGLVQPPRQLKGFRKVSLRAGEATRVRFPLRHRSFSYWDEDAGGWAVAPGCYRIFVGRSSRNLPLRGRTARAGGSCG